MCLEEVPVSCTGLPPWSSLLLWLPIPWWILFLQTISPNHFCPPKLLLVKRHRHRQEKEPICCLDLVNCLLSSSRESVQFSHSLAGQATTQDLCGKHIFKRLTTHPLILDGFCLKQRSNNMLPLHWRNLWMLTATDVGKGCVWTPDVAAEWTLWILEQSLGDCGQDFYMLKCPRWRTWKSEVK